MDARNRITHRIGLALAIALALLLAACRAEPTAAPAQETIPAGTYTATFTAADNLRVGGSLMTGEHSLIFTTDGDFTVIAPKVVIRGKYTVTGDQVKFEEINPSFPCEREPVYVYRWQLEGDQLTFSTVEDPCRLRELAVTMHPYVREE